MSLLENLAKGLQKDWPETEIKRASSDDPVESIIVTLPVTEQAALFVKLSLASTGYAAMKKMGDPDLKENQDTFSEFDYLQFYMPLPVEVRDDTLSEVALLIERINSRLPLIGFNLNTANQKKISYRYMMLFEQGKANLRLVNRSLTLIIFLVNQFLPAIHAVATGDKKLSEIDI